MKFAPTVQELNSEQHENYRGFTYSVKFIRSSPTGRILPSAGITYKFTLKNEGRINSTLGENQSRH